jgi:hypothetical protein
MKLFEDDLYDYDDPRHHLVTIERSGPQLMRNINRAGATWEQLLSLDTDGLITLGEYAHLTDAGRAELARARARATQDGSQ